MVISRDKKNLAKKIIEFIIIRDIHLSKDALSFLLTQQNPSEYLVQVLKGFDKKPLVLSIEHFSSTLINKAENPSNQSLFERITPIIEGNKELEKRNYFWSVRFQRN